MTCCKLMWILSTPAERSRECKRSTNLLMILQQATKHLLSVIKQYNQNSHARQSLIKQRCLSSSWKQIQKQSSSMQICFPSSLSLTIAHIKKNASISLSPQDNPSPKNNQQQQNLSTKFSEPVKCSNPLLESKTFLYKKCCACHIKSSLSLSL